MCSVRSKVSVLCARGRTEAESRDFFVLTKVKVLFNILLESEECVLRRRDCELPHPAQLSWQFLTIPDLCVCMWFVWQEFEKVSDLGINALTSLYHHPQYQLADCEDSLNVYTVYMVLQNKSANSPGGILSSSFLFKHTIQQGNLRNTTGKSQKNKMKILGVTTGLS